MFFDCNHPFSSPTLLRYAPTFLPTQLHLLSLKNKPSSEICITQLLMCIGPPLECGRFISNYTIRKNGLFLSQQFYKRPKAPQTEMGLDAAFLFSYQDLFCHEVEQVSCGLSQLLWISLCNFPIVFIKHYFLSHLFYYLWLLQSFLTPPIIILEPWW